MRWQFEQEQIDCESCHQLYDGEPPCDDCEWPEIERATQQKAKAIELWRELNFYSRPMGMAGILPIPLSEMITYLTAMDESNERLQEVMLIEALAYPALAKPAKVEKTDTET